MATFYGGLLPANVSDNIIHVKYLYDVCIVLRCLLVVHNCTGDAYLLTYLGLCDADTTCVQEGSVSYLKSCQWIQVKVGFTIRRIGCSRSACTSTSATRRNWSNTYSKYREAGYSCRCCVMSFIYGCK